jgi:hypothetical protein
MEVSQGAVTEFTSRVVTVGTRAYNPVLSPTVLNQVRSHDITDPMVSMVWARQEN